MRIGMGFQEAADTPLPLLLDLIAVQQIKEENFHYVPKLEDDQAEVMRMLQVR